MKNTVPILFSLRFVFLLILKIFLKKINYLSHPSISDNNKLDNNNLYYKSIVFRGKKIIFSLLKMHCLILNSVLSLKSRCYFLIIKMTILIWDYWWFPSKWLASIDHPLTLYNFVNNRSRVFHYA